VRCGSLARCPDERRGEIGREHALSLTGQLQREAPVAAADIEDRPSFGSTGSTSAAGVCATRS
jgi:hypothetical protein